MLSYIFLGTTFIPKVPICPLQTELLQNCRSINLLISYLLCCKYSKETIYLFCKSTDYMKPFLFAIFILITAQFLHAGEILKKELPMPIDTFIQNHYPKATGLKWVQTESDSLKTTLYLIHLHNNGLLVTLEMTAEGLLLVRETEITLKDIPSGLRYFTNQHKIKFIAYVEYHDDKPVYVLESVYKGHSHVSVFNSSGILLRTEKQFALF